VRRCLRLAPENKVKREDNIFFVFLIEKFFLLFSLFCFGGYFLEVLKGQGGTLNPVVGNLGISGQNNPWAAGSREAPYRDKSPPSRSHSNATQPHWSSCTSQATPRATAEINSIAVGEEAETVSARSCPAQATRGRCYSRRGGPQTNKK